MTHASSVTRLPTGVVTFLLTDVEGSTGLWEAASAVMPALIARHYELLHDAVRSHGGSLPVEQGEGDSIVAAFRNGSDAVAAALSAQRAFLGEAWPDGLRLAVRMALHTGETLLRGEGNYVGETIIRTARLRSLAHGGQVVASRACVELLADTAPSGAGWRDLGSYRLRNLGRPERVFQLTHPDLPDRFPPVRGVDLVTNNLPTQLTEFIGREAELAQLHALLDDVRLLTVTGSGGCGKTRLALHAAADRIESYPDGVWYVELAPLGQTSSVVAALAEVLRVQDCAEVTMLDSLVAHLRDQRALVVIDNCEHLLDDAASLVEALLRGCPALRVMTTSRQPLNLPGEVTWRVPSLRAPDPTMVDTPDAVSQFEAVQLFVDRAVRARPNFRVSNDNAAHVAQICHQLDGIPLAIELAAARVRSLSVARIAAGLDDRFHLLRGGSTTLLARQQTLEASIEWSHQLLDDPERILLRRLALFTGGFTLDAAEAVCGFAPLDEYGVLELLSRLVDRSLVVHDDDDRNERYRLLETIKQFAHPRLEAAGEMSDVLGRHLDHYGAMAARLAPDLETGAQLAGRAMLVAEHDNVRLALEHAATCDDPQPFAALVFALVFYWLQTTRYADGLAWLTRAIDRLDGADAELDARLRWALGYITYYYGDFLNVEALAVDALRAGTDADDPLSIARATDLIGDIAQLMNPMAAADQLESALSLAERSGNEWTVLDIYQKVAWAYLWCDRYGEMQRWLDAAYARGLAEQNPFFVAWHWNGALTARAHSGHTDALEVAERARTAADDAGDLATIVWAATFSVPVLLRFGQADVAAARSASIARLVAARAGGPSTQNMVRLAAIANQEWNGDWASMIADHQAEFDMWADAGMTVVENLVGGPLCRARVMLDEPGAAAAVARFAAGAARLQSPLARGQAELFGAIMSLRHGDPDTAATKIRNALQTWDGEDYDVDRVETLDLLAWASAAGGDPTSAGRYHASAANHRARAGWTVSASELTWVDATHAAVGDAQEAFARGVASAADLELSDTVELCLRARGTRLRPSTGWASLTPTERNVIALVALGRSNPQIAEQLFMSRATVKTHLNHVFTKLGITTRSELASEWTRRQPPE